MRSTYIAQTTIAPDGTLRRRFLRAGTTSAEVDELVTRQAFHKARRSGASCLVEVRLPVATDPALTKWLVATRFPGGIRWVLPAPGERPPTPEAEPVPDPLLQGLTAELIAHAAHDLWLQKRANLGMAPEETWEALTADVRTQKRQQAEHLLRVVTYALTRLVDRSNG